MNELTSVQIPSFVASFPFSGDNTTLDKKLPKTYQTYRTIRKDPTIAMARALSMAPVIAGEWSIEAKDFVPDEIVDFVRDSYFPIREFFLEVAMSGGIDYGWQGFEQIYEEKDGKIRLKRLKPLIPDLTTILINKNTGSFAGYRQSDLDKITVPVENALHVAFRVEGTDWRGESLLESARKPYDQWEESSKGARLYDTKVAGSHFVVYYPMGETEVSGVLTDNSIIAKNLLKNLEASGGATIPRLVAEHVEDLSDKEFGWDIVILADPTARQFSFTNRLEYLDKLKVRSILIPERAIIEGKFGTKADAGSHADLALTYMEITHRYVTSFINWHSVNRLVVLNFGEEFENSIKLESSPLQSPKLAFFRNVYESIIKNPTGFVNERLNLDIETFREELGLPQIPEEQRQDFEKPEDPVIEPNPDNPDNPDNTPEDEDV